MTTPRIWIALFITSLPCVASVWDESVLTKTILDKLEKNLSHVTRPSANGESVQVEMSVDLLEVRELSKKTAIAELYVEEKYMWYEPRVQWEPSEFPGVSRLRLPASAIWRPDVFMTNDLSMNPDVLVGHVTVTWDGHVTWSPRVIHRTKCAPTKPASRRNRLPEWMCGLDYASKDFSQHELNLQSVGNDGLDARNVLPSEEWAFEGSSVQNVRGEVAYTLTLAEVPYVRHNFPGM